MTTCPDCGKPLYEDSIHSCFPLALYLAEQIEAVYEDERMLPLKAAVELRRLHAENEALRAAVSEALRWCPGGCHAQYLLKTALARAGEVK